MADTVPESSYFKCKWSRYFSLKTEWLVGMQTSTATMENSVEIP